jgi:opacity protein-like surface antigen
VAEYGQLKFGTPVYDTVTQFSGYVSAGYTVLKNTEYIKFLQPVFRYEHFDPWKEDPTRKGYRESVSAGLRYSPFDGWIVKAAYQITKELYGPGLANNGFAGEVVFEF